MQLVKIASQPPEPAFEPVPGCPTCAMWLRLCTTAWRIGGPTLWLHWDVKAELEHGKVHEAGEPPLI